MTLQLPLPFPYNLLHDPRYTQQTNKPTDSPRWALVTGGKGGRMALITGNLPAAPTYREIIRESSPLVTNSEEQHKVRAGPPMAVCCQPSSWYNVMIKADLKNDSN
ncbi:zinc finger protein 629-like protein [Platysternon megacephalum]|uniref:Zinc finger protein 629-like protein n=1 Tax=Platysternon megacephalum TaxID=55544 RepID=A0A4D9DQN0_9SAUR|nr:zinc finger protein 629-like protein [Platysternon megacephalum]